MTTAKHQKPGLGNEALSTRHGAEAWDPRCEGSEGSTNTQYPSTKEDA